MTQAEDTSGLVLTSVEGVERAEIRVPGSSGPYTFAHADLVAALGSKVTFRLRAYAERAGFHSLTFDQVTVFKV